MRKMEGRNLQFEGVQKAPEPLVSQVLTKEKGKEGEEER